MEMAKRNRLSELYAIERELLARMTALRQKADPGSSDEDAMDCLAREIESVRRRMNAVQRMPDEG